MGICGSVDRVNSGRLTYTESSPARQLPAGNTQQHVNSPDQTSGVLAGLSSMSPSRSVSRSSLRQRPLSPSLRAVSEVMRSVRAQYYKAPRLKSSNKKKNTGFEEAVRIHRATAEIARMRQQVDDLEEDVVSAAMDGNAHNCGELATLAVHYLQQDHNQIARLAFFNGTAHTAAIIGPVPGAGTLPADMTDWDADIYVCDPWCNIACRANDYPAEFKEKMEKWDRAGKQVWLSGTGFVSPTSDEWISTVLGGEKKAT
ncbi:hypothetical protein NCPPB940_20830 [Xanthomonas hortorum pv. taraxaci]|nr:hypothetical protein NCPPB940_20830 [Xanthomonas hortorum pv. taraxaci]CAD0329003.1 hypothetical protein NCPPB940_20830 [Xanthomonas hortorum pv. taraxaci]